MQHLPYEECREIERTHVCGVCGNILVTFWDGRENSYAVACGLDRSHQGFARQLSFTQMRQAGISIPIEIEQTFQRREERIMKEQAADKTVQNLALVPNKDAGSGSLLPKEQVESIIQTAKMVGLNPYLGHVVMYYGKPYVTEAGLLYHAHRSGKFDGLKSRPMTKEEREDYQIAEGEYAWIAEAYHTDTSVPFTGIGRARHDPSNPIARGSAVEPMHPQRMAEKRAEMQALRKAFPVGLPMLEEEW